MMVFEIGKCYKHTTGKRIRILCEVDTYFYGRGLLAESDNAEYIIVGMNEDNTINWTECKNFPNEKVFGYSAYKDIKDTIKDFMVNKGYTIEMIKTVIEQNFSTLNTNWTECEDFANEKEPE